MCLRFLPLLLPLFLAGCDISPPRPDIAVVDDVQVATASQVSSDGSILGGAAVGYMLAGPVGAGIGAASEADRKIENIQQTVLGCRVRMLYNGRVMYYIPFNPIDTATCSLLRKGDKLKLDWAGQSYNGVWLRKDYL